MKVFKIGFYFHQCGRLANGMLRVHQSQNLLLKNENRTIRVQSLGLFGSSYISEVPAWNEIIPYVYLWVCLKTDAIAVDTSNFEVVCFLEERGATGRVRAVEKPFLQGAASWVCHTSSWSHMWLTSRRGSGCDVVSQQSKPITYIICSSSGTHSLVIYVPNKTKHNLFTLLALGRAWLPTRQALSKVTVGRTPPWARPTVEPARPSTSDPVRTPRPTMLRSYRNLPTACKLLWLVCESRPASDLLSRSMQPSLRHWDWCLHLREDKHLNHSFCVYLNCAAK